MLLDQAAIDNQLTLLATHRRTLAHLLQQAAQFGGEVFAPPQTANGVAEARAEIQRIKVALREGRVVVQDAPNDERSPQVEAIKPVWAGGVLRGDTRIDSVQPALPHALHQLRAPVGDFVGREREIERLVQALSTAAHGGASAAIGGIRGMGGIGKTELAYTVAQHLAGHLRHAQLIVELHGAGSRPLTPAQALQHLLRSFAREAQLPDELSQLQALYRSTLSGMRALIVADDAMDAAQVRPLLPPQGCALLVTSRHRFSLPGMVMIDLGTLPPEDADTLLLEICPRIGEHARELAQRCGELPLALRVSASLLANSSRTVARYLEQLAAERLRHLRDPDDPQASVEASLQLSYDALTPERQDSLCQLSVFPTSFDHAAALAVVTVEGDVAEVLELLRRRSLLEWDTALERYSLHELVRAFAAARLEDADAVRLRHAQHYAKVASHAEEDLYLKGEALAGLSLFDQEQIHIDVSWRWARARAGAPAADAVLLAYASATRYIGDVRYDIRRERIPQLEAARAAAQRLKRRGAEGTALGELGNAYADLGDALKAIPFHEQHVIITREIGDRRAEGQALGDLGSAYWALGDARKAIPFHEQHVAITREIGDRRAEGQALGNLGNAYAALGDTRQAVDFYHQRLLITREIGDRRGEGITLGNLGNAYADMGDTRQAIDFYEQALVINREIGFRRGEGADLGNLGVAYAIRGDSDRALDFYAQRMVIAHEIGDRSGAAADSWSLGKVFAQRGDLHRAIGLMNICVDFEREIRHPDAEKDAATLEQLRQQLAGLAGAPRASEAL